MQESDGPIAEGGDEGGPPPARPAMASFVYNPELLVPGLQAPVPLRVNPKFAFQAVVRDLLVRHRAPPVTVEPCAIALGSMAYGCQEIVAACQDLIVADALDAASRSCGRLATGCREISGNFEGAYVVLQAVEGLPAAAPSPLEGPGGCSRMKKFGARLERFLRDGPFAAAMTVERLACLEVQLDAVFDQACRQLERLNYAALHRDHGPSFAHFARRAYQELIKMLIPEHLFDPLGKRPGGPEARTGLLELIPELREGLRLREPAAVEGGSTESGAE